MKVFICILALAIGFSAQAKLNDFNTIIEENSKAQGQLHKDLSEKLNETRVAVQGERRQQFLVDSKVENSINVPTEKGFLTFSKEKNYYRASESQEQKRLAQELESAE